MKDKPYGGVWDIPAKNIRCKDGPAALDLARGGMIAGAQMDVMCRAARGFCRINNTILI